MFLSSLVSPRPSPSSLTPAPLVAQMLCVTFKESVTPLYTVRAPSFISISPMLIFTSEFTSDWWISFALFCRFLPAKVSFWIFSFTGFELAKCQCGCMGRQTSQYCKYYFWSIRPFVWSTIDFYMVNSTCIWSTIDHFMINWTFYMPNYLLFILSTWHFIWSTRLSICSTFILWRLGWWQLYI